MSPVIKLGIRHPKKKENKPYGIRHPRKPPDPMYHIKIFKDQPYRFALCELTPNWYKKFPPDPIDLTQMKKQTELNNKTSQLGSHRSKWAFP